MKLTLSSILHRTTQQTLWLFIKSLISTLRFKYEGVPHLQEAKSHGTIIFAIWHEQMVGFLSGHAWTEPYMTLASRSKDGDYAAFVSSRMGFTPVRGSSKRKGTDKGGSEAIEEYIDKLSRGISGGITVDGPKGPRHTCKIGIAKIAQQSGRPIVPGVAVGSNQWVMNSWDKFKIPKPFSTVTIRYAEPIWVSQEATQEELIEICKKVERELEKLEASTPTQ